MATPVTPTLSPSSRRSSFSCLPKPILKVAALSCDAKSVQDLVQCQESSTVRKTASFHCLKLPVNENKRKLEHAEPVAGPVQRKLHVLDVRADCAKALERLSSLKLPLSENKRKLDNAESTAGPSQPKILASETITESDDVLHCKVAARYSSELDDSVISFLSEQTDLLGAKLDISVGSGISEAADRTPSVEDLPIECEAVTPGQVTSVMSLDTGYQGDGELSRPESRNAESEIRILKTHDDMKTMTDSDFFTESDADGHDETGMGRRGDRKAQVIDGTLYGGPNERSQAEDMESSGIYSDLEKKPDPPSYHEVISQQIRTIQNLVLCQSVAEPSPGESMVKSSSGDSSVTIQETPSVKESPADSLKKEPIRKNKMPNRNVSSKIKTMIEREAKAETKPRTPKRGRWDEVMNKIAANREKQPTTPRLQEVKSKVFMSVRSTHVSSTTVTSSSPDSTKSRSRRSTRVRCSESSLVSPKSKQSRTSANSSPHSSISDLSVGSSPSTPASRGGKKRDGTGSVTSRDHHGSATSTTPRSNVGVTKGQVLNNNQMKAPITRRPTTPRTPNPPLRDVNQNGVVTKSTSVGSIHNTVLNHNNNNINNLKAKVVSRNGKVATSPRPGAPRVSRDITPILRQHLSDSNRAVDALAALLNYCTRDLDAFGTPQLKKQLELRTCRVQELETELNAVREACLRLEKDLKVAENSAAEQRGEESQLRALLESEKCRVLSLQQELDATVATCQRLEDDVKTCQNQLRLSEKEYRSKLQALEDLSARFDQVLNLKRETDASLRKSKELNESLSESLRDKESEVNVLMVENGGLKERVSLLSVENESLKGVQLELERLRLVNANESAEEGVEKTKEGLCVNQRLAEDKSSVVLNGASDTTLLSEVESLHQVLSLKNTEVTELRRQQLHLKVEAERVPKLLSLVTSLEAKVEDLQSQLSSQQDAVRNLTKQKDQLQDELKAENTQKTRLAQKNEELMYKLRVNSEAMWQLVTRNEKTVESSTPISTSPRKTEPNGRPQMVSIVQKSDSVSYMLDMGENTEELVSSIVRRAESARSQTLPKKKRARTLGSLDTPGSEYYSCVDSPMDSPMNTPRRPSRSRACIRLTHDDFANDSIDVPREADCDVIEISRSFDRAEPDMSCSTSSNSSSNFDIESEAYPECHVLLRYHRELEVADDPLEEEEAEVAEYNRPQSPSMNVPLETEAEIEDTELAFVSECAETPELLAGEAMVSSDDEEIKCH